jgi:uncharacterized protein
MSLINRCLLALLLLLLGLWAVAEEVQAQIVVEEGVSFGSGDVTLHGTLLIPAGSEPGPAIVLIHGAGRGLRDQNRVVAEAFANEGFMVLIYDKRTEGYSADPVGSRSYSLLAGDAVAAVQMLQQRDDVDPTQVGLWGLSEGGWVAPLAATRSEEVAFVITVAGGGVGPAEQTAWATEGELRRQGVTSEGSLRALADHTYRFLVSAELFAEGTYDPMPILEDLQQPILAIWGAEDRIMPAAASARAMQQALARGGNQHYVLRLVPDASHSLRAVVGGETSDELAPGYVEMMAAWIWDVLAGDPPGPSIDPLPADEQPTRPGLLNPQGFARWQAQLGFLVALNLLFGSYLVAGLKRRLRRSGREPAAGRWLARTVAVLGLIVTWGVYIYTGFIAATAGEWLAGVIAGRPAGWLLIQLLAVTMLLATIFLGFSWYQKRATLGWSEFVRLALLLVGGILFVPWAIWWQLFSL